MDDIATRTRPDEARAPMPPPAPPAPALPAAFGATRSSAPGRFGRGALRFGATALVLLAAAAAAVVIWDYYVVAPWSVVHAPARRPIPAARVLVEMLRRQLSA